MTLHIIGGRYELQGRIGVGGMSVVELAVDLQLKRKVAVKLLAEHLAEDQAFIGRFQREAESAARLSHPNIVSVFDFGLDEDSSRYYLVMEYVPGQSCKEILFNRGTLDVREAVDIVAQACTGLTHAHRKGVVHRDVKPANLLVSDEGVVKLVDFGIAKAADQNDITKTGSVMGTAPYLAPEQMRGEPARPASDIYALGVVAYQLMAGRVPYEGKSLPAIALQQQDGAPPKLHELNPEASSELSLAVARALALDAASRYPDAAAMGEALREATERVESASAKTVAETTETAMTALLADDWTKPTRTLTGVTELLPPYRTEETPVPPGLWDRFRQSAAIPKQSPLPHGMATALLIALGLCLLAVLFFVLFA